MKKQRVDEEAKLSKFMHNYLKKSTDHEKAVIQDDHNHRSKLTQGSHHDVTTSEPYLHKNSIFDARMKNTGTRVSVRTKEEEETEQGTCITNDIHVYRYREIIHYTVCT